MTSCDAIIIGAGHNGLTVAALLAASGRRVVVLEAAAKTGGCAVTTEIAPGFRTSGLAHLVNRIDPDVARALRLDLATLTGPVVPTVVLAEGGEPAILRGGYGETVEGVSGPEAASFAALREKLMFQASVLKRLMRRAPPIPGAIRPRDGLALAAAGLGLMRKGRAEARDFLRMILTNVADTADEFLTDDRLKGVLAFDATLGAHLGPRSPGSLMGLYYRLTGEAAGQPGAQVIPSGGMGALAAAFEVAATRAGATVRTSAKVVRILADRGTVSGVELAGGEVITAPLIVSAIHPATTFLTLLGPGAIETGLARATRHIRSRGNVAKLNLALSCVPEFTGVAPADLHGRLVIARGIDHVETAFNPAKYGEYSPDPVMEIILPSLTSPDLAPEGCTLSAMVEFAPYSLREGWESGAPKFLDLILATLERHAPGLRATIVNQELLTPRDIEMRFGLPGGHWHHGEMQPDQLLLNRPVHATAGYATPLDGLYLASAGSHPGGGLSGLPGYLAARRILSEARP